MSIRAVLLGIGLLAAATLSVLRGHNLGKLLVDAFTQTARTLGFQYAVLDSHKSMTAAHDIYKNSGFKVVKSPPDFPEALKQSVIFMRCVL